MSQAMPVALVVVYFLCSLLRGVSAAGCQPHTNIPPRTSGTISYNPYNEAMNCVWSVNVTGQPRIAFTWNKFIVDGATAGCPYDALIFYDGPDTNAPVIARLCGTTTPQPFVTSGISLTVQFISDAIAVNDAWITDTHGWSFDFYGTASGAKCGCKRFTNGTGMPGGLIQDPSPFNSMSVEAYRQCGWLLYGASHVRLHAIGPYFNRGDTMYIYDGPDDSAPLLSALPDFSGDFLLRSTGQYMYVYIENNGEQYLMGFNWTWQAMAAPEQCGADFVGRTSGNSIIDMMLGTTGHFQNPAPLDGTVQPATNELCEYHLNVPFYTRDNWFNVTIVGGSLDTSSGCTTDYFGIWAGYNDGAPLVARLCGTLVPTTYSIEYTQLFVRYITDGTRGTGTGVSFVWNTFQIKPKFCYGVVPGNPGSTLQTPIPFDGYQPLEMGPGDECLWTLTAPHQVEYRVNWAALDIDDPDTCLARIWVDVHDGASIAAPLMGRFCAVSQNNFKKFRSSGPAMTLHLVSTVTTTWWDTGFTGSVFNVTNQPSIYHCAGNWTQGSSDVSGNIASVYPYGGSNYMDGNNCTFIFDAGVNARISLAVLAFDVPDVNDHLMLWDGAVAGFSPNRTVTAAGMVAKSTGRYFVVTFKTNVDVSGGKGFNATWSINYCPDVASTPTTHVTRNATHLQVGCSPPLFLNGAEWALCGDDNQWHPAPGTCTTTPSPPPAPVSPPPPPPPKPITCATTDPVHGHCAPSSGAATVNISQPVQCKCDPGYTLLGAVDLICIDQDTWDQALPTCIVTPDVVIPQPTIDSIAPSLLPLLGGRITITGRYWQLPLRDVSLGAASIPMANITLTGGPPLSERAAITAHLAPSGVAGLMAKMAGRALVGAARALLQSTDGQTMTLSFTTPPTASTGYQPLQITDGLGRTVTIPSELYFTDDCPNPGEWGLGLDCKPCPEGGECPGGYRIWPKPGYWNEGEGSGYVDPCPEVKTRCLGGRDSACAPGYDGPLCASCASGFYDRGTECVVCPSEQSTVALYVVNAILFALLAVAFVALNDTALSVVVTVFKVLQIIRNAGKYSGANLPEFVKTINEYLALISFDYDFVKPACGADPKPATFSQIFWGNAVVIVCLVAPSLITLIVLRLVHRSRKDFYTNRIFRAVSIYLTLLYFVVATRVFQAVHCTTVGTKLVLKADPTTSCTGNPVVIIGWVGILFITAATPVSFLLFLLRLKRKNLLHEKLQMARYGYLYDGLKMTAHRYLYGVVPFFHLQFIALSWTVFPNTTAPYGFAIFSFSFITSITAVWRPYDVPYNNGLMVLSYGVGLFSVVASLLSLSSSQTSAGTNAAVLVCVGLIIVGLALGSFLYERRVAAAKVKPLVNLSVDSASVTGERSTDGIELLGRKNSDPIAQIYVTRAGSEEDGLADKAKENDDGTPPDAEVGGLDETASSSRRGSAVVTVEIIEATATSVDMNAVRGK